MLSNKAKQAIDFAYNIHHNQVDKADRPYFGHVLRVALEVWPHGEDYFCAALLHDVIEDGNVKLEEIEKIWGKTIADAVDSVTRRTSPVKETYMELINRAANNPIGRIVKLADNADNSDPERIAALPKEQQFIVKRYRKARIVLEGFGD